MKENIPSQALSFPKASRIHPKYGTIWSTDQDRGRRFGSTLAVPVSLLEWSTQKANDLYKDHLDG